MQSANRPISRRRRTPLPDPEFVSSASLSLMDDLCDPNSDLTTMERAALFVVFELVDRRTRPAGHL